MLADWLAILHRKPAGTPLPWQRNKETFVLNGHPERPGSKFKPEWIYAYRPPLSERWRIRGGRPRWSYASLAHGLKLDYRAYYPTVWPGYDPPEYVGTEGVRVNATHFAAFAREVFSSECD